VTSAGLLIFAVVLACYGLVTQHMPMWVVELMLAGTGLGMGLTMSPATNAIMTAVPREKAGAGAAVNNTVRQVGGAIGVAVLGSILAVLFRSHLGAEAPQRLAATLDQPAAVVARLPADQRASTYVTPDTSQSIGDALPFVGQVTGALHQRAVAGGTPASAAQQVAAQAAIGGFVDDARSSFIAAMRLTSLVAGIVAGLGAIVAFVFLPNRRQFSDLVSGGPGGASGPSSADEPEPQHAAVTDQSRRNAIS
jgi:hypothetical protein